MIAETLKAVPSPTVGPDEPAAEVIRLALCNALQRLAGNATSALQGQVEGVHRMRTAARRLRCELRLFRDLIEAEWPDRLSEDLKWLGHLLGAVRDTDVIRERLRDSAAARCNDLGPLFSAFEERHAAAAAELRGALEGDRYEGLLGQIHEAIEHPNLGDDAWQPCRAALPSLVRGVWKRLESPGRRLDLSDSDEQFHEVRKRAKRARYSAESVADGLDSEVRNDACRFARRVTKVQDVLGEHQDATVACQEIRRIAAERASDGPFNLAAGQLLERQENAASQARTRFFKIWHKLDRKKNRRWMKV